MHNSKFRRKLFLKYSPKFPGTCFGQSATFKLHILHASVIFYMLSKYRSAEPEPVFFALKRRFTGIFNSSRYIVVRKDQVISFPTQFCVAVLLQHFPCLNFYSFLCVIADSLTCIKKVNA